MQVLVVEDHQDSREELERYLTRRDYDVAAAGDLRTGIHLLNEKRFDAIMEGNGVVSKHSIFRTGAEGSSRTAQRLTTSREFGSPLA
jgi:hypothetical protein